MCLFVKSEPAADYSTVHQMLVPELPQLPHRPSTDILDVPETLNEKMWGIKKNLMKMIWSYSWDYSKTPFSTLFVLICMYFSFFSVLTLTMSIWLAQVVRTNRASRGSTFIQSIRTWAQMLDFLAPMVDPRKARNPHSESPWFIFL